MVWLYSDYMVCYGIFIRGVVVWLYSDYMVCFGSPESGYIYIYMLPPPSVIYLFRGLPGHAGEHVPKTRGHVHFLMRTHVDRIWQCAVRIVFILAVRNIVHVMKRSYP